MAEKTNSANAVGDIVRFENVGMRYRLGAEVLHDVSFSLPAGSFHFLTGPSGAEHASKRWGDFARG